MNFSVLLGAIPNERIAIFIHYSVIQVPFCGYLRIYGCQKFILNKANVLYLSSLWLYKFYNILEVDPSFKMKITPARIIHKPDHYI